MANTSQTTPVADRQTVKGEGTTTSIEGKGPMVFPNGCTLERTEGGWLFGDRTGSLVIPNEIAAQVGLALVGQGGGNTS